MSNGASGEAVREFLIIGPSRAGKTALVATLFYASQDPELIKDNVRITMSDTNAPMATLLEQAKSTVRMGRLPIGSTDELTEYTFTLTVRTKHFLSKKQRVAKFTLWDGPGGSLFPNPDAANTDTVNAARYRARLIEALKTADGLLLCLDSSDVTQSLLMFEAFPSIFMATGLPQLPCKRVCVCLTKADRTFEDKGAGAIDALEDTNAWEACGTLLPKMAMGVLSNYCTEAEFAFAWTSVYGFLAGGAPNYDSAHDKLLSWSEGEKGTHDFVNAWHPYGVLEPFLWLAGERPWSMDIVRGDNLVG